MSTNTESIRRTLTLLAASDSRVMAGVVVNGCVTPFSASPTSAADALVSLDAIVNGGLEDAVDRFYVDRHDA